MFKISAAIPALLFGATLATVLTAQAPAAKKTASSAFAPRKADEFVIHMPDGSQKLLSAYRGKLVLMAFMYTTCPHCQRTAGILSKIQTDYAAKGVQILGVTFDPGAQHDVVQFDKVYATGFPCGYSIPDQVVKFLNTDRNYYIPMLAFIDRTGMIRLEVMSNGDPNGDAEKFLGEQEDVNLRAELDKLLKSSPSAVTAKQAPKS